MYDAPFDALTRTGWILGGLVLLLFVVRAVRVEVRATRSSGRRRATVRLADLGLDAASALAAVGFVTVLVLIVVGALTGSGH